MAHHLAAYPPYDTTQRPTATPLTGASESGTDIGRWYQTRDGDQRGTPHSAARSAHLQALVLFATRRSTYDDPPARRAEAAGM